MKVLFYVSILFFSFSLNAYEVGGVYKLKANVFELTGKDNKKYGALKNSRFLVVGEKDGEYLIQFSDVYGEDDIIVLPDGTEWASTSISYTLPEKLDANYSSEYYAEKSLKGLVSGPMIIPFKWRRSDNSISGEATVGAYAGISFESPTCNGTGAFCFQITPILSAGLSQISIYDTSSNESETRSGITMAAGLLLQNWGGTNIGILYGKDRIGDTSWEYEGDGWWSFSIAWQLTE